MLLFGCLLHLLIYFTGLENDIGRYTYTDSIRFTNSVISVYTMTTNGKYQNISKFNLKSNMLSTHFTH